MRAITVQFDWETDDESHIYDVEAGVHLGRTSAIGDDPNVVTWLTIYDQDGQTVDVPDQVYKAMEEQAIMQAISVRR